MNKLLVLIALISVTGGKTLLNYPLYVYLSSRFTGPG